MLRVDAEIKSGLKILPQERHQHPLRGAEPGGGQTGFLQLGLPPAGGGPGRTGHSEHTQQQETSGRGVVLQGN